jgi:hypothetical protein
MKKGLKLTQHAGLALLIGIASISGAAAPAPAGNASTHIERLDPALDAVIVAANLAFAEQGKAAYITATSSIYKVSLRTPGSMPLYQR